MRLRPVRLGYASVGATHDSPSALVLVVSYKNEFELTIDFSWICHLCSQAGVLALHVVEASYPKVP